MPPKTPSERTPSSARARHGQRHTCHAGGERGQPVPGVRSRQPLDRAVVREVLEETGIKVGRVDYHASQPWPFPGNIMLGFYAEALTEEITIDPAMASSLLDESAGPRWCAVADIPRGNTIIQAGQCGLEFGGGEFDDSVHVV
mgnify:CR=1 FL=1